MRFQNTDKDGHFGYFDSLKYVVWNKKSQCKQKEKNKTYKKWFHNVSKSTLLLSCKSIQKKEIGQVMV